MDKMSKSTKNFFSCFLNEEVIQEWNMNNPDMRAELILFCINS